MSSATCDAAMIAAAPEIVEGEQRHAILRCLTFDEGFGCCESILGLRHPDHLQRSLGLRLWLLSSLLRVDWAAARPEIPGEEEIVANRATRLLLTFSDRRGQ